jgi:hypothetical protein
VRAAAGTGARVLHHAGHRAGPGGDPPGRRGAQADAVRHLLRHRGRACVRARLSRPGRAADPRLRDRSGRRRPVRPRGLPRDDAVAAGAVPGRLPGRQRGSGGRPRRADGPAARRAAAR